MNYILFDNDRRDHLLPLTYMRPEADIRIGIMTIREKWEWYLNAKTSSYSESYLAAKFPLIVENENLFIDGTILPDESLVEAIHALKLGECLMKENRLIAFCVDNKGFELLSQKQSKEWTVLDFHSFRKISYSGALLCVKNTWDIFKYNGTAIERDFALLTHGRKSAEIAATNQVLAPENIFLEEGVEMHFATINAQNSKVYIGKNAKVQEGVLIRGSLALCDNSQLNMGAKIYGPTTVGPFSKVGGELNNSVLFAYSNKGHEGFLGNSVIAEWCNIGADSNTSNLKNTYQEVKLWDYVKKSFQPTGEQFAGLIMGDHSKCGINTMFNTGTVVGVNANIYGAGFQRNFIPSFSWGSPAGMQRYNLDKAYQVADVVFKRRKKDFDQIEKDILAAVYKMTIEC